MPLRIHTAPPGSGEVVLGRTLPSLLDEACDERPNARGFNQPAGHGWRTVSNTEMSADADALAAGLLALDGLDAGTRVAFFMHSDVPFTLADFATLVAGLVSVPIYLTNPPETTAYILQHAEAKAVIVSDVALLEKLAPVLGQAPELRHVILAEGDAADVAGLPEGPRYHTLDAVRDEGRRTLQQDPGMAKRMRERLDPTALATIIYTSGTTGTPKGVMLSHQNISSNVYTAFRGFGAIEFGDKETALSYLPMTHVFARVMVFGHTLYGHPLYYSNPDRLVQDLAAVRPTIFASVPRVIEKVWDKVTLGVATAEGAKKKIGSWALALAGRNVLGKPNGALYNAQRGLADKLVYSKLRGRLGLDRIKFIIIGGAALRSDLANAFEAMGIPLVQGYGLTETSPVITFNRPTNNRAGSTGQVLAGVEMALAEDGEILTRGPHVMMGYYKQPEQTDEVMDAEGWLHTGDIGEVDADGFLKITDRKKDLFKLSTGKYAMPTPVENELLKASLIEQAVVMGADRPYCTALLFPSADALAAWANANGLDGSKPVAELVKEPAVLREYERIVGEANKAMPEAWSQVKRFRLIPDPMTVDNALLTPKMSVKRAAVRDHYEADIARLYAGGERAEGVAAVV